MEPNHLSFSPKGTPRTPSGLPAINEDNILDGQVRRLASLLKKSGLKTGSKRKVTPPFAPKSSAPSSSKDDEIARLSSEVTQLSSK